MTFRATLLTLVLCASFARAAATDSSATRPFRMGFCPWPWDVSLEAVNGTYDGIVKHGDMIAHHIEGGVPWTEALDDKPFARNVQDDWKLRKSRTPAGFMVYLALSPLDMSRKNLAGYKGEQDNLPLPEAFKGKAFGDPMVKKAYLNYCRRAVEFFKPDYLAIAIEANELTYNNTPQWAGFVDLYKHVYAAIRKDHPKLPIFATLTLHSLLAEDKKSVQIPRIKEFLPLNDIAAISFYAFMQSLAKPDKPADAFAWLKALIGDKPIAISENCFPAEPTVLEDTKTTLPGTPEMQKAYLRAILDLAKKEKFLFVVWFLYRDYDQMWEKIKTTSPSWAATWRDTGFLDGAGKERPAFAVWKESLQQRYARP